MINVEDYIDYFFEDAPPLDDPFWEEPAAIFVDKVTRCFSGEKTKNLKMKVNRFSKIDQLFTSREAFLREIHSPNPIKNPLIDLQFEMELSGEIYIVPPIATILRIPTAQLSDDEKIKILLFVIFFAPSSLFYESVCSTNPRLTEHTSILNQNLFEFNSCVWAGMIVRGLMGNAETCMLTKKYLIENIKNKSSNPQAFVTIFLSGNPVDETVDALKNILFQDREYRKMWTETFELCKYEIASHRLLDDVNKKDVGALKKAFRESLGTHLNHYATVSISILYKSFSKDLSIQDALKIVAGSRAAAKQALVPVPDDIIEYYKERMTENNMNDFSARLNLLRIVNLNQSQDPMFHSIDLLQFMADHLNESIDLFIQHPQYITKIFTKDSMPELKTNYTHEHTAKWLALFNHPEYPVKRVFSVYPRLNSELKRKLFENKKSDLYKFFEKIVLNSNFSSLGDVDKKTLMTICHEQKLWKSLVHVIQTNKILIAGLESGILPPNEIIDIVKNQKNKKDVYQLCQEIGMTQHAPSSASSSSSTTACVTFSQSCPANDEAKAHKILMLWEELQKSYYLIPQENRGDQAKIEKALRDEKDVDRKLRYQSIKISAEIFLEDSLAEIKDPNERESLKNALKYIIDGCQKFLKDRNKDTKNNWMGRVASGIYTVNTVLGPKF